MRFQDGRARRKERARRLVAAYDLDALAAWSASEPLVAADVQRLLFEEDPLLRWRAVEAFGRVAAVLARDALEPAQELVRRILWLMNDESGGALVAGPEAFGAVLASVPALAPELAPVLASFLDEEPFRAGTRWALWRVGRCAPGVVRSAGPALRASLGDADPQVRGHTVLALRAGGEEVPEAALDAVAFAAFDPRNGQLRETTVADAARAGWALSPER